MTGVVEQRPTTTTQRISPKKSSSLWKRFMKKSSNNNNNAAASSNRSVSATSAAASVSQAPSSSSTTVITAGQQQTTTTALGHTSPQNSVVADITPTGELSFFEAFSNFEDQSSPTSVRNYPQDNNNNSPSSQIITQAKRSRSGYSRASTVEVGVSPSVTPSRSGGPGTSSSSRGANTPAAATSSTLGGATTLTSSPKSLTKGSSSMLYSFTTSKDHNGGGGTVAGTVAEKSVHTMKSKGSKNTCSTVSLTATYNNDASTMDFSKPQYSSSHQAAHQDHQEGGCINETTTPTRTVGSGGTSALSAPTTEEEDLLVPDWTAFQATSNFGIEQQQETNKETSTANKKKGDNDWDQLPTLTPTRSSELMQQVVASNEVVNHVIREESTNPPTESTGEEMDDDVLLIKETSYIAPKSHHPTESSPPTRGNIDKQSAVAAMMTTSMAQAAAAQAPSTSTSSRSNSMRKAGSKLGRRGKNRGSSLKKRGSDLDKRVSSSDQQEKQAENPIAMAAAKTNKKSANTVTTAIGPSAQQNTNDINKASNNKTSLPSPTSLSPSSKSKKKMLNTSNVTHNTKTSSTAAASSGGAPQPHLYAEISVPTKKTRKHPSSSPSTKSPLSSSPGAVVDVSRQSSTKSHGTNGEADVSLALTSISSLTGRSSLFGNMPLSPSSTLGVPLIPGNMGGIWCQDEELNATHVVGATTNAEEEDYFDYSPNIDENPNTANSNDDEGVITRLMGALSDVLTCRCFDGISGDQIVGVQQEGGGDNATTAAPSGKSVMSGGMGATLETVMNDTAATIANTMMSTTKTQGVGTSSKAPTFSDPMEEI